MILRKRIDTSQQLDTKLSHHLKRRRTAFRYYCLNNMYTLVLMTYVALFALCASADVDFRPHRPHRPMEGWFYKPRPPLDYPTELLTITDLPTTTTASPTITELAPETTTVGRKEADADGSQYDEYPEGYHIIDGEIFDGNNHSYYPNNEDPGQREELKTAEEELNEMIEGLDNLLSNESAVVTIDSVSDAFDQMDVLLATEDERLEFPCTVLTALDALGARADLNGSTTVTKSRRNVAVVMADSAPGRPVRGLRIAVAEDGFTDDTLQILQDGMDPATLTTDDTEAVVNLPASLAVLSRRISFVVFRSDRAFIRHDREQVVVNSKIISVNVENFTQMEEGEVIDIHLKPSTYQLARNMTRACAYWHFAGNDTGYWSQEGCTFIRSPVGLLDTCRCTHLTHFAEILIPKPVFSEEHETALEIISLVGCFMSLFGLIIIGLTAILFRSWRSDFNNKIWIQLTIALLINIISFLFIVFFKFEDYGIFCMILGISLHYAVLASFCWMLVAAVISYRKLVLVFARDPRHRLLKVSAFSWLVPLAIVGTLLSVAPQSYTRRYEEYTPTGAFCYPTDLGLWLSVYLPIAIVVALNWIIFGMIIRSVFGPKNIQKHGDSREMLRRASVSCLLVFLFGLPWIFGLFAYNIVAAYLFTIATCYQGFVLFIFFIIINTKTRALWLNKMRIKKKTKAHVSSSMITSRNAPASDEQEQSPFIELSSTRTNLTSLLSNSSDGKAVVYNVISGSAVIEDSRYNSKASDIDSFITAKSHDNFSEDEIFKSVESIANVIEDKEENNTMQPEFNTKIGTKQIHSSHESIIVTMDKDINDRNSRKAEDLITPKTVQGSSLYIPEAKVRNVELKSDNLDKSDSSQKEGNEDEYIGPEVTLYSVPTRKASLISECVK